MARSKQEIATRVNALVHTEPEGIIHTWIWEGMTLQIKHVSKDTNGQWVRIVETGAAGEPELEFSRVFWHLDSNIQDLEAWGTAAAEVRFPPEDQ